MEEKYDRHNTLIGNGSHNASDQIRGDRKEKGTPSELSCSASIDFAILQPCDTISLIVARQIPLLA